MTCLCHSLFYTNHMSIDRTLAPDFKVISSISLPETQSTMLDNGIPLHVINIGEQPVIRLEVIFDAGNWYESEPGASFFAAKMMTEGTSGMIASEISEAFDKLGAFIDMTHSSDRCGIVVYCLSRFLPEVLSLVSELIQNSTFPEKELDELRNITLQNLRVNQQKTAYLASTALRTELFGATHPYGQSQDENRMQALPLAAIKSHFTKFIKTGKSVVVLAGQVGPDDVSLVNQFLGQSSVLPPSAVVVHPVQTAYAGRQVLIEKEESVQSSIRMGKRLFNRHHADYFKMLVANEILGGYFGSRLMKNIREEKGLTYGISSSVVTLAHEGYFLIGTDVKKEFTQQTIDEIKKEIYRLQTEPVADDELQTVKNFMAGEFAGSLNTAFEVADRRKILLLDGLPADFFGEYVKQIHATTAEDIQEMACRHMKPEDMVEVVVGGK
jgi:zinc protease